MGNHDIVTHERLVVDKQSGEIIREETVRRIATEPQFIKLYIDSLFTFKGLSKSLNPILLALIQYMTYASSKDMNGGQIIYLNRHLKEKIAEQVNKGVPRVEQALTQFVKAGIFNRIATGTYQVNPSLFGKGEWKEIKNIRATYDYGAGTVETEIIKETDE